MDNKNNYTFLSTPPNRRSLGLKRLGSDFKETNRIFLKKFTSPSTNTEKGDLNSCTPQRRKIPIKKATTEPVTKVRYSESYEECNNNNSSAISIERNYSKKNLPFGFSRDTFQLSLSRSNTSKVNRKRLEFIITENNKVSNETRTNLNIEREIPKIQENYCDIDPHKDREGVTQNKNLVKCNYINLDEASLRSMKNLNLSTNNVMDKIDQMSTEEIAEHINNLKIEMKNRQNYLRRTEELRQAVDIWRFGFTDILKDFRQNFLPHCDYSEVLKTLHISAAFLHYVDN